ncbi:receptor-like protein 12 [Arachis ipaensis]|uniref:receptor-like protein 12 n=1 Tax=Arachis ipaensis TaxID=130454 RepID=UPI000A2B7CF5|nr:receptor-like protein 12 [Arachis ipaensis]XP_025656949.1 receptor-like protein EIX2 [Arachis hypogaea]
MSVVMMKMNNLILIEVVLLFVTVDLLLVCATAAGGAVKCAERERQALLDFKAAMVDDYGMLSSWKGRDCCHWNGVGCSNLTAHVISLDLHGDYYLEPFLRGKIPSSLVELQHLRYLNLSFNRFEYNHIPEYFGNLTCLRYLDLSSCGFGGRIPTQFGSLPHLTYLNLNRNELEGSIPYQLGNLSKLQYLDLSENALQGTIPSQLGNLSSLHELSLGGTGDSLKMNDDGEWLSTLTSLTHLGLSSILNLNNSYKWIQAISNISTLTELVLFDCALSDHFISSQTLRLSKFKFPNSLSVLDLSYNTFTSSLLFQWLSNVTSNLVELYLDSSLLEGSTPATSNHFDITMQSLERLYISHDQITARDFKSFANICTLSSLSVFDSNLTEDLESILHNLSAGCVTHSLQELYLGYNQITGTIPDDLSIFPFLKKLSLFKNQLRGKIPDNIRLPSQLKALYIIWNSIEGGIPKSFGNICSLESLDLSYNKMTGELPVAIQHLSGCARYSLQHLYLQNNQFNGTLPDISSIFPSLITLSLSQNKLNGKVPEDIRFPSQLKTLMMNSNSLEGVITESHFYNLSNLKVLGLSGNSFVLKINPDWIPPFQLQVIMLQHCMVGPYLPKWLQTQKNLMQLDISNAGISDITSEWFWALSTRLNGMNISYNNLTGIIPDFPLRLTEYPSINLASNQFEGSIPLFLRNAVSLDLSNNKFSDVTSFVCANDTAERLGQLDISNNYLSGQIPDCWENFKSLVYIDVSNNNFSGQVPTSMGSVVELRVLILRNNSLTGELPFSMKHCKNLVMLDAGENKLSGIIPSWIGSSLQQLQMLSLRKNHFFGSIPSSLCFLNGIRFLDLSVNHLWGPIPKCFINFTAMTTQERFLPDSYYDHSYTVNQTRGTHLYNYDIIALLMWKGVEHIFENDELLLKGIDLSSNHLSGDIPSELENLVELVSLNLSRNNLTGKIPSGIGRLLSLESLDLSRNHLFGSIPSSLAQIDFLSVLDLSHNNLSGQIPTSTQLQSFNASSYEENQNLCGLPLEKMCPKDGPHQESLIKTQDENDGFIQAFFASMGLGFFVGFWGIFGTILFNRSWRHAYFRFLNNITEKVMSRWQRW